MDKDYQDLKDWLNETRDEPLETMAGFFEARLQGYEEHMSCWQKHYQWMAKLLPPSVETLLDMGCGTGLELDCIFARFPHLGVTGIDLSEQMLAKLKEKHGDKNLSLICADYFSWEMGEEKFDAVVSFETLHHFTAEKKTALFSKIYRSLKPGGLYLECDYIAVSQAIEDLAFAECRRRRQRDGIKEEVFVHFDTPLTLGHEMQALEDAGFEKVELVGFLPGDSRTAMLRAVKEKGKAD